MPTPRTFLLAAVLELAFDAVMLAMAWYEADRMPIPGLVIRLALMGLMTALALRGHRWARWVFFSFEAVTAMIVLLFTFVDLAGAKAKPDFSPLLGGLTLFYASLATLAALPPRPKPPADLE
jgi:hypothetical protein